jgi:transcriptional regulator
MYVPTANAVTNPTEIEAVLASLRLGCLVTHDPEGLFATHLPFTWDSERRVLSGHVARANPHWKRGGDAQALVIFQGVDAYITPSWYPSKFQHGRVVPTWSYEVVHIYGAPTWHHDQAWLLAHLAVLTDRFEATSAKPWSIEDAPRDYIERHAAAVVGVEIAVDRVEAKRKLSQNRAEPDRLGVIAGLSASESPSDRTVAQAMVRAKPI